MARKPRRKLSDHEAASLTEAFRVHERYLWGLCYRLTGTAADADDILQDTFARALERPPPRTDEDWRPWLVRVAMNLGRDLLRRRRFRGYVGPWLPSPIDLSEDALNPAPHAGDPTRERPAQNRYTMMESASLAFLSALEQLTPSQRAVLLLRDVFDYSVRETSAALEITQGNVKTTLHRARRAMAGYGKTTRLKDDARHKQATRILNRFMSALLAQDVAKVEGMLRDDVRAVSDGGGVYNASAKPVVGIKRVARMYLKLAQKYGKPDQSELQTLNGLPALITRVSPRSKRDAPMTVMILDIDNKGAISGIYSVMAPRKLTDVSVPE